MPAVMDQPQVIAASFPVFRTGLVLESNLDLSEAQARAGVSHVEAMRDAFHDSICVVLTDLGGTDIQVLPAREARDHEPDTEGRSVKLQDVVFVLDGYELEARAGMTICEGRRQSKIAVRILCIKIAGQMARALPADDVTAFFNRARDLCALIQDRVASLYKAGLCNYLKAHPKIAIKKLGPAHEHVKITEKFAFTTKAYDSGDQHTFGLIEELSDGDKLSDLVQRKEYRDVFANLWNIAHALGSEQVDVDTAIKTILSDERREVRIMDGAYLNEETAERTEQRALIVANVSEPDHGLARIEFTGVMPDALLSESDDNEFRHASAAFRLSEQLFAKYAGQF